MKSHLAKIVGFSGAEADVMGEVDRRGLPVMDGGGVAFEGGSISNGSWTTRKAPTPTCSNDREPEREPTVAQEVAGGGRLFHSSVIGG